MTDSGKSDEEAVDEAYRNYVRAQISMWTNRVRAAKESLAQWQLKLHAANTDRDKSQ